LNPDALAQLRDIHLPEPIGWWPPAPGWWLLAVLTIIVTTVALNYLLARRRRVNFRRQAKQLLAQSWDTYQQDRDDRQLLENLLTLVRRVGKTGRQHDHLEAMTATQLIRMLDDACAGALSTHIPSADIESLLYRRQAQPLREAQARQLYTAVAAWLKRGGHPC
tara:strand:+ start:9449 stop:9940 length:492 start_codon:yes stop_codon:yes gene_type:complete